MTPNILHVEAMPDYDVLITYENGEKRIFSVKPYLGLGLFSELRDEAVFRSVRVSFDTISLDCVIGPRTLLIPPLWTVGLIGARRLVSYQFLFFYCS